MSKLPYRLVLPSAFAAALSATPVVSTPAQAVSFQFDFGSNTSDELQRATQEAAGVWSSLLKDDVTVNLRIDYADLSEAGSVLGGVQPGKIKVKYEDYVEALFKDATSSDDFLGVSTLPLSSKGREAFQDFQTGKIDIGKVKLESKEFAFLMDGQFAKGGGKQSTQPDFLDNNGNNNNKNVLLTRAQAKALNLLDSNKQGLDGLITINSNAVWDFDRSDGIDDNRHDISSVLQHEIGHALGFVSGVDALDFLASASEPVDIENNKFSYLTPLDFYRYSAESSELGVSDVTLGGSEKYFSLDGGNSAVVSDAGEAAYFSTGSDKSGGDGYQGSHWKSSGTPLGIMNPNLQTGQSIDISSLDLMLLDVIGWNTKDTFAERAAAVGFDWPAFDNELKADRQQLTRSLVEQWDGSIPNVEAALADAAAELDLKFRQKLQDKFDELVEKLAKESDPKKRDEALNKFYKDINKESEKRNESIRKLPKEIIKVDNDVRKWLDLPVDKLTDKIRDADGSKINRFSNIIKSLPEDDRDDVEERLEAAASELVDNPGKLVEDLLKTSGPANPIGWNNYLR
ncbi:MAG: NF038122 family metalloprotease, partial [Cyanobacteria bacterium J06555_13]